MPMWAHHTSPCCSESCDTCSSILHSCNRSKLMTSNCLVYSQQANGQRQRQQTRKVLHFEMRCHAAAAPAAAVSLSCWLTHILAVLHPTTCQQHRCGPAVTFTACSAQMGPDCKGFMVPAARAFISRKRFCCCIWSSALQNRYRHSQYATACSICCFMDSADGCTLDLLVQHVKPDARTQMVMDPGLV